MIRYVKVAVAWDMGARRWTALEVFLPTERIETVRNLTVRRGTLLNDVALRRGLQVTIIRRLTILHLLFFLLYFLEKVERCLLIIPLNHASARRVLLLGAAAVVVHRTFVEYLLAAEVEVSGTLQNAFLFFN